MHNLTLSFLPLTIINVSLYSGILFALNFIVCGQSGSTIQNDHFICKTVEFRKKKYWTQNVCFVSHYYFLWTFLSLKIEK